ncbi:cytochrome c [Chitinophaga skermanii]|uniref:Cytochrome c n=1 Tax=Chitinophaga skermanii TaxID=331697 RepID=A0A327R4U0_9BACT|nr:cytochrome c [Chitinophaga skermanii]RAJ10962.1 cytochrome c [Chitinophaga skermanii]
MNFRKLILLTMVLVMGVQYTYAADIAEGKEIFLARCASCHNVNKKLVGPALAGVGERRKTAWIEQFIHSSQTVIKSGDKDALALYNEYNQMAMPDHQDLTAAQIASILEYIKSETKATEDKPPFERPGELQPNYKPIEANNWPFFVGFGGVVILLILAMVLAVQVKSVEREKKWK